MLSLVVFGALIWALVRFIKKFGWGGNGPKPPHPGPGWGGRGPAPTGPLPKKWPGGGPDVVPDWVEEEVGPVVIPRPVEAPGDDGPSSPVPSTTQPLRMS